MKVPRCSAYVMMIENHLEDIQNIIRGIDIEEVRISDCMSIIRDPKGKAKGRGLNCTIDEKEFYGKIVLVGRNEESFIGLEVDKEFQEQYPQLWEV